MNKKILAAAALALVSGSALADAKLYGIMDVSVANISNYNSTNQTWSGLQDGVWLPSLWGITGGEDMGDGMKAFFDLQSNLTMTNGNGAFGSSQLFDRAAYVGISGDFGKVSAGERLDPIWLQSIAEQAMGVHHTGSAALQSIFYQSTSLSAFGTETVGPVMSANWLYYEAPKVIDNVSLTAAYQFGNVAGSTSDSAGSYVGATYAKSGLTVNLGAESQNDSTNLTRLNRYLVGAMYTVGDVTVEAQQMSSKTQGAGQAYYAGTTSTGAGCYGLTSTAPTGCSNYALATAAKIDAEIGQIGVAYKMTPKLTVGAQYVWINDNIGNSRPTLTSLSLVYALSGHTNLYIQAESQTNSVTATSVPITGVYGVGYSSNGSSTTSNSSMVAVGMNHLF